jgi:hypothetical protein
MADDIPAELRAFIAEHIHSVAKLEALLLLYENPQRSWTAGDAARAIYIAETPTAALLADMLASGLLVSSDSPPNSYRYAPKNEQLIALVQELARYYRERRVTVITLIHSAPVDKLRTFADAFRFTQRPKES